LTELRARFWEAHRAQASYLQARASAAQGRWEDAIPSFARVAELDSEGSWGILAQHEVVEHWRTTGRVAAARDAERAMVSIASRTREVERADDTPFGWEGFWEVPRDDARWSRCVDALRAAAGDFPDSADASRALQEADRIEHTRIRSAAGGTQIPMIKANAPSAEAS
jgi:hypothetical protein